MSSAAPIDELGLTWPEGAGEPWRDRIDESLERFLTQAHLVTAAQALP